MNLFVEKLAFTQTLVNNYLHTILKTLESHQTPLVEAISYSILNGGKRIRPFLCLVLGDILKVPQEQSLRVACAIELLHSYSLIHDDLPAMDNSDLRRGKPSCHIRYNEATAILAGDAMLAFAFEILSDSLTHPKGEVRCELINLLAKIGGPQGMALGQMMDVGWAGKPILLKDLKILQKLKTSLLIEFSCLAPAILKQSPSEVYQAIRFYSEKIGLLFQIVDDILDFEGSEKALGKPIGQDSDKVTFVTLLGIEKTKAYAKELYEGALKDLNKVDHSAEILRQATQFIFQRTI